MPTEKHRSINPKIPAPRFASLGATVARKARDQALAAGLTVTTHKEGRLVREMLVGGQVIELFIQDRENVDDWENY